MKVQQGLMVLATLSMLGLNVACNSSGGGNNVSDRYQEGFDAGKAAGYKEGYDKGYSDGDTDGYARAKTFFASSDYNKGFSDGKAQGYTSGVADGKTQGYNSGYDDGYKDGKAVGGDTTAAYNRGYSDGTKDGYDMGYTDGTKDGYDLGYNDGYKDGYAALSVGPTQKLQGYANLLSLAHNDMFDYSQIPAPQETARGLVANGRLLFSETSLTNKDTLKRQAAVEDYLVVEMAKQVQVKFGLSAERSLKIAKASNHFRKQSSKRALTAEDTNAYASEIIGVDIPTMQKAFDASRKGDLSGYQSALEQAAQKNGTSPEKMSEIVTKLFI